MLGADSLYGSLLSGSTDELAGPSKRPKVDARVRVAAKVDEDAGDIFAEGPASAAGPSPEPQPVSGPAPAPKEVDEVEEELKSVGPATAEKAQQEDRNKEEKKKSSTPLPAAFSAAKLMMPAVRKKAEPPPKRASMPALDLHKLQQEKEALLRQRSSAAAEKKNDAAKPAGMSGFSAASFSSPRPESASNDSGAAVSTSSVTSAMLYGSPDEDYDPAKPNDYDEFCRRRMRIKAEEEMERRRQEILARQVVAEKPPEPKEDDFATRMMKKMGWKDGAGLGKEGQGMTNPLIMKKTDQRAGVITEGQKREAPKPVGSQPNPKQAKPATTAGASRPPTRVLLLNNLVGAGEVDEDLEEETAEEAGKYGKLRKCVVKEIKGLPDDLAVRIFLEFEAVESSKKALIDMNGRFFGGRVVKARFFDEARFAAADLLPKDGE